HSYLPGSEDEIGDSQYGMSAHPLCPTNWGSPNTMRRHSPYGYLRRSEPCSNACNLLPRNWTLSNVFKSWRGLRRCGHSSFRTYWPLAHPLRPNGCFFSWPRKPTTNGCLP